MVPQNFGDKCELTVEQSCELRTMTYRPNQITFYSMPDRIRSGIRTDWKDALNRLFPIWTVGIETGNELCVVVGAGVFTDDEIIEQIGYIYEKLGRPFTVELGNEIYAIAFEKFFAHASDYYTWASAITDRIKRISPELKCIAIALSNECETDILSDKENTAMLEQDWAYTQAHRVIEWNSESARYTDKFDGFTVHEYCTVADTSKITAEEFRRMMHAYTVSAYYSELNIGARLADKPLYITEWGNLAAEMFWGIGVSDDERTRLQ